MPSDISRALSDLARHASPHVIERLERASLGASQSVEELSERLGIATLRGALAQVNAEQDKIPLTLVRHRRDIARELAVIEAAHPEIYAEYPGDALFRVALFVRTLATRQLPIIVNGSLLSVGKDQLRSSDLDALHAIVNDWGKIEGPKPEEEKPEAQGVTGLSASRP